MKEKTNLKTIRFEMVLQTEVKVKESKEKGSNQILSVNIGIQDGDPNGIMIGSEEGNTYITDNWQTPDGNMNLEGANALQQILVAGLMKHIMMTSTLGVKSSEQTFSELAHIFSTQAKRQIEKKKNSNKKNGQTKS